MSETTTEMGRLAAALKRLDPSSVEYAEMADSLADAIIEARRLVAVPGVRLSARDGYAEQVAVRSERQDYTERVVINTVLYVGGSMVRLGPDGRQILADLLAEHQNEHELGRPE